MKFEKTIEIEAPLAKVWAALVDIQNWPLWSESMTKIERVDDGPFGTGREVLITQPNVPPLTWKVVAFQAGDSFVGQATGRWVTTRASHQIAAMGDERCAVTLAIKQSGALPGWRAWRWASRRADTWRWRLTASSATASPQLRRDVRSANLPSTRELPRSRRGCS